MVYAKRYIRIIVMAISYNSSIVTTNLIACFDPGNPRTYPGSGTAIRDASGNGYTGTLVNGPTYSSANGGVFVLDGVNDYIDIPGPNMASTNYTIIGAAKYVVASGRTFSGRNNNWLMGQWSNSTENYYAEGWVAGSGTGGPTPSDTNWRIYAATGNIAGDNYALYVNGALVSTQSATGGSQGPNGLGIGCYFPGVSEFSNSQIGILLIYNTVLTEAQIIQNFNAYRGRYGL
jgi:hypothetical protein